MTYIYVRIYGLRAPVAYIYIHLQTELMQSYWYDICIPYWLGEKGCLTYIYVIGTWKKQFYLVIYIWFEKLALHNRIDNKYTLATTIAYICH